MGTCITFAESASCRLLTGRDTTDLNFICNNKTVTYEELVKAEYIKQNGFFYSEQFMIDLVSSDLYSKLAGLFVIYNNGDNIPEQLYSILFESGQELSFGKNYIYHQRNHYHYIGFTSADVNLYIKSSIQTEKSTVVYMDLTNQEYRNAVEFMFALI